MVRPEFHLPSGFYARQNAKRLAITPRRAAWYPKPAPTFADALGRLRHHFWFERIVMSARTADMTEPISPVLKGIIEAACYAPQGHSTPAAPHPEMGKVECSHRPVHENTPGTNFALRCHLHQNTEGAMGGVASWSTCHRTSE